MKHNVQESIILKKKQFLEYVIVVTFYLLSWKKVITKEKWLQKKKKRLVAKFAVAFTRMMADIHPSNTQHLASMGTRVLNFAYLFAFKFRRDTSLPAVVWRNEQRSLGT